MKPSNEFCINFLKASGWLDNHDKQIRKDAIDECKQILLDAMARDTRIKARLGYVSRSV